MRSQKRVTDTCIGCGRSFTTEYTEVGKYKILVKDEDVWARQVKYKCPACGLSHQNIQARIKKPKQQ